MERYQKKNMQTLQDRFILNMHISLNIQNFMIFLQATFQTVGTINVDESGNEDNIMVLYLFVLGVSRCKIWRKSMVSLEIYFTI